MKKEKKQLFRGVLNLTRKIALVIQLKIDGGGGVMFSGGVIAIAMFRGGAAMFRVDTAMFRGTTIVIGAAAPSF
ncbi:hypothetical protein EDC94DRAFT_658693 [Helicostylum pulchrum]|nr:hypothetical protein EDC94DRAFT_658693 [Helicostylum pulchrum]